MTSEKEHSPKHKDVLKKQKLEQAEVKEVLKVIRKYGVPLAIVVVVLCAIALFNASRKSKQSKQVAEAASLLASNAPADLQNIVENYSGTPAEPLALMSLAQQKFSQGLYDKAAEEYSRFLEKHATHELAEQAAFNKIMCLEAKEAFGEAQTQYAQFVATRGDSYLAPLALLGKGRCLEHMGQLTEAKQAYEDLMAFYPTSGWIQSADEKLTMIESKLAR